MLAPVIVFAYNRPEHLRKTLDALSKNLKARDSKVFVFIDGPKDDKGLEKHKQVVSVAESYDNGYFESFHIRVSNQNNGLAKSIIGGVSEIIEQYEKVIVIEDDAISAQNYLEFMNDALDYYQNDDTVWSIGGYTVPMQLPDDYQYDVIKTQRVSSYAWATWKDRWDKIDWEVTNYKSFRKDLVKRHQFNRWGNDRSCMLDSQMNGFVNSWAIRFDYAMFSNNMFNIVPRYSLIKNIGHDGSGTHSNSISEHDEFEVELKACQDKLVLEEVDTIEEIRREFCKPFRCSLRFRAKEFILHHRNNDKDVKN